MSYLTQSRLARDSDLLQRITACAAIEGLSDPQSWAANRAWQFSAQPGWVAAYKTAGTNPGANETAITDAMILTAVRALNNEETTT
ncbi:hypothetical protein [Leucobacter musarum]|uniref:hypothetical protein n=1 Tax=Leucobacter musarum TaxID=1930747 RepID=UPI0006A7A755|nr:hypothetical protein [Leucobacter musarum]